MNNYPWFKMYGKLFLVSTSEMTNEEVGAYTRMICTEWENGSLNSNPNRLPIGILNAESLAIVLAKFEKGSDGRLRNKFLESIRDEITAERTAKSEGGKKGSAVRWGDGIPNSIPNKTPNSNKNKSHIKESEPKRENNQIPFDQTSFDLFWQSWPKDRRVGKADCLKWFKSNKPKNVDQMIAKVEELKKSEQWQDVSLIPHPIRWLRRGGWDDAAPTAKILTRDDMPNHILAGTPAEQRWLDEHNIKGK